MGTNTILAAGTSEATASIGTLAAGATLDIYLSLGSGVEEIPTGCTLMIQKLEGANYVTYFRMTSALPAVKLEGAGVWRVKRTLSNSSVGLISET